MPSDDDDWRLTSQEPHLTVVPLQWSSYTRWSEKWDHDHCEFCFARFEEAGEQAAPDSLTEGYSATEVDAHGGPGYHWICSTCFDDFKGRFRWQVVR